MSTSFDASSAPRLAVLGSTGQLGGRVAQLLADQAIEQRLLVRDPLRAPQLPGAVVAPPISYSNTEPVRAALAGVEVLFMVSAAESADRLAAHRGIIDAAAEAGVGHVVYTSFCGAAPDSTFTLARDHWATEEHLAASGMALTALRDNFYLNFLPHLVGEDDVIRGPAGEGRVAAVSREDVARVAAAVLSSPEAYAHQKLELTGPESLSMTEVATRLSSHFGRPIRYHNETLDEAYESRRRWPAEQWQYDAWVSTYTAIAAGDLSTVTDTVERVTGQPPMTLDDLLATAPS